MGVVHRPRNRNDPSSPHREKPLDLDNDKQKDGSRNVFLRIVPCILLLVFLWTNHLLLPTTKDDATEALPESPRLNAVLTKTMTFAEYLRHPRVVGLQNCTVAFQAPPDMEFLPIWMPSFPASGAASASKKGDLLKPIVDKLTGWSAGSKNYHMSIRNKLRRCHAVNTPTAVCSNGHPLTAVGPQNQVNKFHRNYIMVVRNFITLFPAMMQDKAFAYHGAQKQVPNDEWKRFRDEWTKSSFATWKSFFSEWRGMVYEKAMYVVYEKLLHPDTGIAHVQRLAGVLREAGLHVAPAEDIPCIWYQAVAPEYRRLQEFYAYEPGYTEELQQFFRAQMEQLMAETKAAGDEELVAILTEYLHDYDTMKIDR